VDLVEVGVQGSSGHGMQLHFAHEHHALVQLGIASAGMQEANQMRTLEVGDLPLELLRSDHDGRRGPLWTVENTGHLAAGAQAPRRTLAAVCSPLDADLDRFHSSNPHTKRELIEASSWMRRMASPSSGATGRTWIFDTRRACSDRGIVSVTTSASMADASIRAIAGPDNTGCVAHARTAGAPARRTASAAVQSVPAVSTMSSTRTATRASTSPMICISAT